MTRLLRSAWLLRMVRRLTNWRPVWAAYTAGRPVPELHLRNGVRLTHAAADAPVLMLFEVFADGTCRRHLRGPVVDIGAAAIDLAVRAPGVRVHSYEPNPATAETCRRNVAANRLRSRITVYPEAVGSGRGTIRLWVNGPSVAATAYADAPPFAGSEPMEVPVVGLAEVKARVPDATVGLLTIDAEGAEADILEGVGADVLGRIDAAAIEYHTDLCPRADERCQAVLEGAGFTCLRRPTEPARGMLDAWRNR